MNGLGLLLVGGLLLVACGLPSVDRAALPRRREWLAAVPGAALVLGSIVLLLALGNAG